MTISQVPAPTFFDKLVNELILKPGSLELIDLDAIDMIPLAGFLLEYPYAYVVSTTDGPFLSGVNLSVYECTVHLCGKWTPVVKFSVPETCVAEDLSSWLMNKFGPRMNTFGIGEPVVTCTTRVMDRINRLGTEFNGRQAQTGLDGKRVPGISSRTI